MQRQRRYSIEDDENVKLPSAYIKKMQNTVEVEKLAIDKMAPSIKVAIGGKGPNVSIRKI